jgi:hypothetical protein
VREKLRKLNGSRRSDDFNARPVTRLNVDRAQGASR